MKVVNFAKPINRIGFVIFCVGSLLIVVSLLATVKFSYYGPSIATLYELLIYRVHIWWQFTFRLGLMMAFFGAWIAWLFDPTAGRVIRWIRSGNWKESK